jgi:hypothetical protein
MNVNEFCAYQFYQAIMLPLYINTLTADFSNPFQSFKMNETGWFFKQRAHDYRPLLLSDLFDFHPTDLANVLELIQIAMQKYCAMNFEYFDECPAQDSFTQIENIYYIIKQAA